MVVVINSLSQVRFVLLIKMVMKQQTKFDGGNEFIFKVIA